MGWFDKLLGQAGPPPATALYEAVVARARQPHWYVEGAVPDSVDGRFDMVVAVLSLVLVRLEGEPAGAPLTAKATERFVEDMDGQLRQQGIGDMVVGKRVGKLMAMLGGRIGAYRDALAGGDLEGALVRNLYRGAAPDPAAVEHVAGAMRALHEALTRTSVADIEAGRLP